MKKNELSTDQFPKVTFGIIVLNGEPFTRYCLEALYPHAWEIIVVEGAAESARDFATEQGYSRDGTLETLKYFKENSDPENKVKIVTKEGFWASRDEQSQAYANEATGDYLWQVDIDEFYLPDAIEKVRGMLMNDPTITGASFQWINFWGNEKTIVDGWFLRSGGGNVNRLMKWGDGYTYGKHWRGPRSYNPDGQDMTQINWVSAEAMARAGIRMYHYSLVFPHQVLHKSTIYKDGTDPTFFHHESDSWATNVWLHLKRPFDVHNRYGQPAWLERFKGDSPSASLAMFNDIRSGQVSCRMRAEEDIEQLLSSVSYQIKRWWAKRLFPVSMWLGNSPRGYWFSRAVFLWLNQGTLALLFAVTRKLRKKLISKQTIET